MEEDIKQLLLDCEEALDDNNATSLGSSYCRYCYTKDYDGKNGIIHENDCIIRRLRNVVGRKI